MSSKKDFGAWNLFLLFGTAFGAAANAPFSISIFEKVRPLQVAEDAVAVAIAAVIAIGLAKLHPGFKWWIGRLVPRWRNKETPGNINLTPTKIKVPGIAPLYLAMLAFELPIVAYMEEWLFRNHTTSWQDALLRSLLFGFVHMLVGVPLCGAIAISGAGLWFSYVYFQGGLTLAAVHHTTYDVLLVLLLLVGVVVRDINNWREGRTAEATSE